VPLTLVNHALETVYNALTPQLAQSVILGITWTLIMCVNYVL